MKLIFLMPTTKYQIICFIIACVMICAGLTIDHRIGLTIQNGGIILIFWSLLSFLVYKILNRKIALSLPVQIVGIVIVITIALILLK